MSAELKTMLEGIGDAVDGLKTNVDQRLKREAELREELERKVNLARIGGGSIARSGYTADEHKTLTAGFRALIAGRQSDADAAFRELRAQAPGLESKAMVTSSGADGAFIVHPEISREFTRITLETAPIIGLARTINLGATDTFEEPVDRDDVGANWVGETESRGDTTTPQLGLFAVPVHEIHAQPKVSQKLLDSTDVDIVTWLTSKIAEKFANTEASAFIGGDGIAKPRGFLTYPTASTNDDTRAWGTVQHIPTGAAGAFKAAASDPADCLIDTVSKLKSQYRANATWVMNRQTEAAVRKLKDAQGRFLLVDSLIAGQPKQLLGYPVVEAEQMPDIAANSLSIGFGDFRRMYTIVRRLGVRFMVDPYTDKPNVKLYAFARVGGAMNNSEAVKVVRFATT